MSSKRGKLSYFFCLCPLNVESFIFALLIGVLVNKLGLSLCIIEIA